MVVFPRTAWPPRPSAVPWRRHCVHSCPELVALAQSALRRSRRGRHSISGDEPVGPELLNAVAHRDDQRSIDKTKLRLLLKCYDVLFPLSDVIWQPVGGVAYLSSVSLDLG